MLNITNLAGLSIGQYTLKEQLGSGGMGVVYRGWQPNLEREVAIKILLPLLVDQEGYIERFTREARTAAALEHAHIVPIYDYGTQQELSYVVMRLLTGGSLAQRMAQRVQDKLPLPAPNEVSGMLKEIAGALDYAHSRGVIHRDIKAGNIMFDNHGSAFLVDFGIAKLKDNLGVTSSGLAVGTPTHMSPEQWRGDVVTPATDQYALGVVIFETISGRLPFESSTAYALMNKHLNEPPTPIRMVRPDLPGGVESVLQQAMAKNPEDRFPTVTSFAKAFDEAIQTAPKQSTQFFTFEVRPLRLKADGELPSALSTGLLGIRSAVSNAGSAPSDTPKAKNQPDPEEMKRMRRAIEQRVTKVREFSIHAFVFVAVIGMLWAIWGLSGGSAFPWPMIVMLVWGAGLAGHGIDVLFHTSFGDRMREREWRKELWRHGMEMGDMNTVLDAQDGEKLKRDRVARLSMESEIDDDIEAKMESHHGRRERKREIRRER